jgi:hypothetical protein
MTTLSSLAIDDRGFSPKRGIRYLKEAYGPVPRTAWMPVEGELDYLALFYFVPAATAIHVAVTFASVILGPGIKLTTIDESEIPPEVDKSNIVDAPDWLVELARADTPAKENGCTQADTQPRADSETELAGDCLPDDDTEYDPFGWKPVADEADTLDPEALALKLCEYLKTVCRNAEAAMVECLPGTAIKPFRRGGYIYFNPKAFAGSMGITDTAKMSAIYGELSEQGVEFRQSITITTAQGRKVLKLARIERLNYTMLEMSGWTAGIDGEKGARQSYIAVPLDFGED